MNPKILLLITASVLLTLKIAAQNNSLQTYYEASACMETPRYNETIEFCKKLEAFSPLLHYTIFGKSPQGRDLPLIIADKNKNFTTEKVKASGNAVILIQACIHAGEPDGKDAGLMLLRDIVTKKEMLLLLDHVTILFIPIFNVDGHERFSKYNCINQNGPAEMGWRTTAQNLNLNRDFIKADAPEMQAWLKLFNEWLPDFFVDCHVTDGADYQYSLTYGLELLGDMMPDLTKWTQEIYLKQVDSMMVKKDMPIIPYVEFRNWHDPRSGLVSWVSPPMLSQGYTAIQNRPGLLIETHMLKDYKIRVTATYEMLKNTLIILNKQYKFLKNIEAETDLLVASSKFREKEMPLDFNPGKDSVMIDFLGYDYESMKSDVSGGTWFKYNNKKPVTFKVPYFNKQIPYTFAKLPEAYIIPPEWTDVIARLAWHGIKYRTLTQETSIAITSYKFKDVKWSNKPYEGRTKVQSLDYDEVNESRTFPAGSVLIDMNQRTARVIAYLFEPRANDSFVKWGFFNTIFEQKEYSESYVMEDMSRKMLKDDPKLQTEFDLKKASDTAFAKNPDAILNWFYSKTPYWDSKYNVYPVGKIMGRNIIDKLK